jgi:hypothetical protein
MKKCRKCKELKSVGDFYPAPQCRLGVRPECKTCNKYDRGTRHQHAKKHNPERRRSVVLKNKYGITGADFNQMLINQNGQCKICKSTYPGPKGVFAVDHCHQTNMVRGLLCYLCNVGLGSFRDNQEFLLGAVEYLKETKSCV